MGRKESIGENWVKENTRHEKLYELSKSAAFGQVRNF